MGDPVEDVFAFPVSLGRHVVNRLEQDRVGAVAQHVRDFGSGPDIEPAFLAFGIGIVCGGERAARGSVDRCDHLAQAPVDRFLDALREKRIVRFLPGPHQKIDDLGVVVEHFLEMRRQPDGICRITGVAAAEMIVDPALGHLGQGHENGIAQRLVPGAQIRSPEQFVDRRVGKFGRLTESAVYHVEFLGQPRRRLVVNGQRNAVRSGGGLFRGPDFLQTVVQRFGGLECLFAFLVPIIRDCGQDLRKARSPITGIRREIRAAPERLSVRRQEHGQRPATLLAQQLKRMLVYGIDIGAFLPVDLHVDIKVVHLRRDFVVFEAFMRHDVAPVAGGVADRQQDGLVLVPRGGEGLRPPAVPVHRIVGMLQKIGTGFFGQAVAGHARLSLGVNSVFCGPR